MDVIPFSGPSSKSIPVDHLITMRATFCQVLAGAESAFAAIEGGQCELLKTLARANIQHAMSQLRIIDEEIVRRSV